MCETRIPWYYERTHGTGAMVEDRTNISVSDELWEELNGRKSRGDSFEDVIWWLIEAADEDGDEE